MRCALQSIVAAALIVAMSGVAEAGDLVTNGVIKYITVRGNNDADYFALVFEGTSPCTTVKFSKAGLGNDDKAADKLYSMALSAFLAKKKVRVFNYVDNNCDTAQYLRISE